MFVNTGPTEDYMNTLFGLLGWFLMMFGGFSGDQGAGSSVKHTLSGHTFPSMRQVNWNTAHISAACFPSFGCS